MNHPRLESSVRNPGKMRPMAGVASGGCMRHPQMSEQTPALTPTGSSVGMLWWTKTRYSVLSDSVVVTMLAMKTYNWHPVPEMPIRNGSLLVQVHSSKFEILR